MPITMVELLSALELVKGGAELFVQSHPEHQETVALFMKDLWQISRELGDSVYGQRELRKL